MMPLVPCVPHTGALWTKAFSSSSAYARMQGLHYVYGHRKMRLWFCMYVYIICTIPVTRDLDSNWWWWALFNAHMRVCRVKVLMIERCLYEYEPGLELWIAATCPKFKFNCNYMGRRIRYFCIVATMLLFENNNAVIMWWCTLGVHATRPSSSHCNRGYNTTQMHSNLQHLGGYFSEHSLQSKGCYASLLRRHFA